VTAPPRFRIQTKRVHVIPDLVIYSYSSIYIHTYVHTCIRTYIHTYMHTYVDMLKTVILLSSKTPKPSVERGIAARGKGREEEP
jgi:G:T-mismatch repair DNA endonuclease (very short patch repair protein)